MKWIEYTMRNGLQAKVAITSTVTETVESIQDEMLDHNSFIVVEEEKNFEQDTLTQLINKIKALEKKNEVLEKCLLELGNEVYQ